LLDLLHGEQPVAVDVDALEELGARAPRDGRRGIQRMEVLVGGVAGQQWDVRRRA
jgi:hypothetical protein